MNLIDEVITDMTDDEKDTVLRIRDLKEQLKVIEYKEAFKLGAKVMYMLNIYKKHDMIFQLIKNND